MRVALSVLAAAVLFLGCGGARAYEKDTHYGLTYYLARHVGYIPSNAHLIADAAWTIDVNQETAPVADPVPIVENITLLGAVVTVLQALPRPQKRILTSFHGFPEGDPPKNCEQNDDVGNIDRLVGIQGPGSPQVKKRLDELWDRSITSLNPGVYFHYYEDTFSHVGFPCGKVGQGHAADLHLDDFLADKKVISQKMMERTVAKLADYMKAADLGSPCDVDSAQLAQLTKMLKRLFAVNAGDPFTSKGWGVILAVLGYTGIAPKWEPARDELNRGLPKDQPIPEFNAIPFAIEGREGNGFLNVRPIYSGYALTKQTPTLFVLNEVWRDSKADGGKAPRVKFSVDASTPNPDAIEFRATHEWRFADYDAERAQWHFTRKIGLDEMPTDIPPSFGSSDPDDWKWAKENIYEKVQLHLLLGLDQATCKLKGQYYRGEFRFRKDTATGNRKVFIPEGKEGWGAAEDVEFVRDFPEL
jgi:hypothetical protein